MYNLTSYLMQGYHTLVIEVFDTHTEEMICPPLEKVNHKLCRHYPAIGHTQTNLVIPGWLTVFPPIITAIVAVVFRYSPTYPPTHFLLCFFIRQVLIALLIGIWLCAFLG